MQNILRVRAAKATLDTKIWDDETVDAQGNVIKGAEKAAAAASKARKAKGQKTWQRQMLPSLVDWVKCKRRWMTAMVISRSMADKRVRILMCIPWTRFAIETIGFRTVQPWAYASQVWVWMRCSLACSYPSWSSFGRRVLS